MFRLATLLTLIHISLLATPTMQTCFRPNGTAESNPEYVPCSTDLTSPLHNICCATNRSPERGPDICVPNGLCQVGIKKGETGKEPAWTKPQCANGAWEGCLGICGNKETPYLTPCDTSAGNSSLRWCCGYNDSSCCNEDNKLSIETLAIPFAGAVPTSASTSASTTSISSPNTLTTSLHQGQITSPSQFSIIPPFSFPSTPTTSSPPSITPAFPSSTPNSVPQTPLITGLSTPAKAGIGIGVSFAALALLGLGAWLGKFLKKRKQGKRASYIEEPHNSYMGNGGQRGYETQAVMYRYERSGELDAGAEVREMLPRKMEPVELDGGQRGVMERGRGKS